MTTTRERAYYPLSRFLRERFGRRVQRISIDAGFTCPNVDGTVAVGGCVYCDNRSFSTNRRLRLRGVRQQIERGIAGLGKRFGVEQFLAYFQAGTNTYAAIEKLKRLYDEALEHPAIVGLMIGTRPDCVPDSVLDLLEQYARDRWVCLEIGLQTIHDRSLDWMNRGHHFDSFVDAVRRASDRGLDLCAHVILGLPGESHADMMATAEACAALNLNGVKIHNLHVVKGTPLEEMYRSGSVKLFERDEYVSVVCDFLERLPPSMVIHRLNGEAARDYHVAPDWCLEKAAILQAIDDEFARRQTRQGSRWTAASKFPSVRTPLPLIVGK